MDIDTLRSVAGDLLGNSWQTRLAKATGVDGSTVRRWLANGVEAPGPVAAYLEALGDRQETRGALLYERTNAFDSKQPFNKPNTIVLDHMAKRLAFPGVDQLKPMPAIHCAFDAQGNRIVRLDGAKEDGIVDLQSRYVMVRHPDSRHFAGYLAAAKPSGRGVAVAIHRFHYYTLVLAGTDVSTITYVIATHAGELRTVVERSTAPRDIITTKIGGITQYP